MSKLRILVRGHLYKDGKIKHKKAEVIRATDIDDGENLFMIKYHEYECRELLGSIMENGHIDHDTNGGGYD